MSKNNNVNPGQYKVAGRERPGEDVDTGAHKATLKEAQARQQPPQEQHAPRSGSQGPEPAKHEQPG